MKQRIELAMAIVVLLCACLLARESAVYRTSNVIDREETCIVIDAGHGGMDSGKVGVHGELEKELNLQIAQKLKEAVEKEGLKAVLTREDDDGLYAENVKNWKVQDLQNRVTFINERKPQIAISIHQNSYTSPEVSGAQVFYYTTSAEGQKLAEIIQKTLIEQVDSQNHRAAKANDTYYLLKRTEVPIVIVECGFLSNPTEAEKLTNEEYQEQLVDAIKNGILEYLKQGTVTVQPSSKLSEGK